MHCGSEIEPLVQAGLEPLFYRIGPDLSPDMQDLERLSETPCRAIWVTHYFGFAQPVRELLEFARKQGLMLIEDTTHGLFSRASDGSPLGSLGHMSVFSFGKTLAIPNGALLRLTAPAATLHQAAARNPSFYSLLGWFRSLVESELGLRYPAAGAWMKKYVTDAVAQGVKTHVVRSPAGKSDRSNGVPLGMSLVPEWRNWSTSPISRFLLSRVDHSQIVKQRRDNYQAVLDRLVASPVARPLFETLPDGCCPLTFPLWVADPRGLVTHLKRLGIVSVHFWTITHPAIPFSDFPLEQDLKRHVVTLPVHQDLRNAEIQRMVDSVNDWTREA